ncbi:SMI1/KNR4 family protein [Clostridium aestuarii]|uniref:SMI1/KNR4 family protein n=1 Tax=Clostridium aestuarii TaxID=338193 RepID=A0ABT4D4V3_9CLOT|nr:SMI1/KNR4 family protein [Clostridium aestuarii]MCY6485230.1 SMI1/KNR4 family protein [Clostridium aestuarii]
MGKLEWDFTSKKISQETINRVQEKLGVKFPEDYLKCVKENNGGYPSLNLFDFTKKEGAVIKVLLSFDLNEYENILEVYKWVKDSLPSKVYPFAADPFGNYICFDYRTNKEEPIIVFWDNKEANSENCIVYICDTFTKFLLKLY